MELINEQAFQDIFKAEVKEFLQKNKPLPRTARLDKETRDNLFHGKGNEWLNKHEYEIDWNAKLPS